MSLTGGQGLTVSALVGSSSVCASVPTQRNVLLFSMRVVNICPWCCICMHRFACSLAPRTCLTFSGPSCLTFHLEAAMHLHHHTHPSCLLVLVGSLSSPFLKSGTRLLSSFSSPELSCQTSTPARTCFPELNQQQQPRAKSPGLNMPSVTILRAFQLSASALDVYLVAHGLDKTDGSVPYHPDHPQDYISKFLFCNIGEAGDRNNCRVTIPQRVGYKFHVTYMAYCSFIFCAQRELQEGDSPDQVPAALASLRDEVLTFSETPGRLMGR